VAVRTLTPDAASVQLLVLSNSSRWPYAALAGIPVVIEVEVAIE
jgi:hypothetical protein